MAASKHQKMLAFYAPFLAQDALAFDIGAYHGSRTAVFRELGARVVAVEPVKESVMVLFARFGTDPNTTLVARAAGAVEGQTEIRLSSPHRFSSTVSDAYHRAAIDCGRYPSYGVSGWEETQPVKVTTVDALITAHGEPRFIKIDVEGWEDQVLAGLSQPVPALSFEFHPHALGPAFSSLDQLAALGRWECNLAAEERFEWILPDWIPLEELRTVLDGVCTRANFLYGDIYARHLG